MEDALLRKYFRKVSEVFLPTPFAWRATGQFLSFRAPGQISIHPRPSHGGRHSLASSDIGSPSFLPAPSTWRATRQRCSEICSNEISTHALHAEGDTHTRSVPRWSVKISTHTLHTEGDLATSSLTTRCGLFLPTPSTQKGNRNPQANAPFPRGSNCRFIESTHANWVQAQPA